MKKLNKKAFTLIELLVVIVVIGILVLLGAPKFTGYTQKAELTRIQHDIKVMEQEVGTVLINQDDDFNKWEDNNKDFNQLIQEGKLFEKEGPVAPDVEPIDGSYKIIPEKYKDKINTKLKGTFYTNNDGKVYYEHEKPIGSTQPEEEKPESSDEEEMPGYSDEEIDDLVYNHNYIPIATADELNSIISRSTRTYGEGTKWEGPYTGGLGKHYVQVANIDLSEYDNWTPIGTNSRSLSFTGTYDGGNYVITGLEVKGEDKDYQGLFGRTEGATISNVGLIDNKVTGSWYVGGLVGQANNKTTISNSYATGLVQGTNRVGGLVGEARQGSKISNSYATGSVTGSWNVGGLVGAAWTNTAIKNSYSTGSVTGTGADYVGGLVGVASSGAIENSYATGSVTSTTGSPRVGGLVGYASEYTIINNSYATGSITASGTRVGGLVGSTRDSSISNSYWDTETTGRNTSVGEQQTSAEQVEAFGKTAEEMKQQTTYSGWDFETVWKIDEGNDYPKLR